MADLAEAAPQTRAWTARRAALTNVRREDESNRLFWPHDRHRRSHALCRARRRPHRTRRQRRARGPARAGLAVAAVGLAMVSREMAEPFVLAILAGLAVVGVFCLFAGAVGILHFGQTPCPQRRHQGLRRQSAARRADRRSAGRVLYANEAYREPARPRRRLRLCPRRTAPLPATPISPSRSSGCRARRNRAVR